MMSVSGRAGPAANHRLAELDQGLGFRTNLEAIRSASRSKAEATGSTMSEQPRWAT